MCHLQHGAEVGCINANRCYAWETGNFTTRVFQKVPSMHAKVFQAQCQATLYLM